MFDLFKELSKPDPENERRRLNLMKRIQERMARDHERDELFYNYAMNDLYNDYQYVQSLPNSCPQKASLKNNIRDIYEIHNNYRNERNELYYNMRSKLDDEIRNTIYRLKETNRKNFGKKLIKHAVSLALGFVPILGNAKGMIDAIIGKDLITDEELSILDRCYSGVSSLPVIGDFISWENWIQKILGKLFIIFLYLLMNLQPFLSYLFIHFFAVVFQCK